MSTRTIKTRIQLRRDTEANYELIKNSFIPLKGEIVLVDTASDGLRAKVGNGTSAFSELGFSDENLRALATGIVVRGYYHNGKFYTNPSYTEVVVGYEYKVYIDLVTSKVYTYDDATHQYSTSIIPNATNEIAGIMKLYNNTGSNVDGTMTQSSITNEINKKFEVEAGDDETLYFSDNV